MPNPVEMIRTDHDRMRGSFDQIEQMGPSGGDAQKQLVHEVLTDLEAHAKVEEEIFYPAARELVGDGLLVDMAEEEHHGAKMYVMELARMEPDDPHYLAKFKVLREVVEHHMEEEEHDILPKIAAADGTRLEQIGQEMERRWPGFRDEAAKMVEGGFMENLKGAFEQLQQARGKSPGS